MSKLRKRTNEILRAIKQGDASGSKELFESTYGWLYIVACKYVYDKNDVEDVLTEAYLKAFRYAHNFDESKDGYNWLCKIVENCAREINKKYVGSFPLDETLPSEDFSELDEKLAEKDELFRILKDLPKEEQRLIYLKFWKDMSYSEIAAAVGGKKSAVHKRVNKILKEIFLNLKKRVDD